MAEEHYHHDNSATTILIAIIVLLIIGLAFYFGFARNNAVGGPEEGVNIELNNPIDNNGAGGGAEGSGAAY